ncbi:MULTISPECIES: hypothetical protein [Streptomyces]|uniref:Uncharacterized protein n=1 Tax=Streptomyces yunnanensis TaxID=156453 RepID=A0ABY8A3J7_9ACTN|nr:MULTISPECIES: hypothetical protein [Streptomyces]AJC53031.1 hypothetical protein GZL_00425 [Streptomyces sp. 769]WEB38127.1 hypothetical protein MOV08_01590 [Streptomyces yunnanensis]
MKEKSSGEHQKPASRRVLLSTVVALVVGGVIWVATWKLEWWSPGLGLLTAKVAVVISAGVVAFVAGRAKRR